MTATRRRICIVTPGYISSTPRVVREADALSAAGYDVRVVFTQGALERNRSFDAGLVRTKAWRFDVFGWSRDVARERPAHWHTGVRHRVAQALPAAAVRIPGVAERVESRVYPELAAVAATEAADLFIGHYPAGLAAAYRAARHHDALLGYDIEDLYSEIWPESAGWAKTRASVIEIERRYTAACAHLTASSAPAAEWFATTYRTEAPLVVHNCHPWSERRTVDGRTVDRKGPALSLYWYSQTVGADRGLQDAIEAAGQLGAPVQIHLRGAVGDTERRTLTGLADRCGAGAVLHFQPSVPPDDLLSRAMEHDVGLALESSESTNRRLTVSNKLCLYLTAGLAVAASDLPGQRTVLDTCREAGALYPSGDVQALANILAVWARDPGALARARSASLDAARTRWNLEMEMQRLVGSVDRLFERRRGRVA